MCWRVYYALLQAKTAVDLDFKYEDEHFYLSAFYRGHVIVREYGQTWLGLGLAGYS